MSAPHVYPPFDCVTGSFVSQPKAAQTQGPIWFDGNAELQHTGFLDAPDMIPSGSVRGDDYDTFRLSVAHVWRQGSLA